MSSTTEDRKAWLRRKLEKLEVIDRPSASPGELEAAEWIAGEFRQIGVEPTIETESAHGTYWWPIGIGTSLGLLGSFAALRGRRLPATLLGALGAGVIATDFPPRSRPLRRLLPKNETYNVMAEIGEADAGQTVVVVAHHDSAHAGFIFHPGGPKILARTGLFTRLETSPMLMAPVIGGPVLAATAGLTGSRRLAAAAAALATGSTAAMVDIGIRDVVPGANDNGSAVVALLDLARRFTEDPPEGVRVILLSVGSEESFSEGMKAFGERHFAAMPKDRTFFINLESVGSPHLTVLRGEGFLKMYDYPAEALELADETAEELGIALYPNLRIRNGTDGLEPLAAGYPTVSICSCTDDRQPANYHWPNDVAANVDFGTVVRSADLAERMARKLGGAA
ncbi:MAG: M28 family peptidase [Actinomycetota bacterium]|nr:M28 family peptidase [Actinomycetota bacterium]